MRLSRMKIKYFRCFDDLEIDFQTHKPDAEKTSPMDGLTVLVGRNGEGKTAVLDAINIAWNPFFRRFPVGKKRGFKESDRPSRPFEVAEGILDAGEPSVYASFETPLFPFRNQDLLLGEERRVFSSCKADSSSGKLRTQTTGELAEYGAFLMERAYRNNGCKEAIWPLLAYYGDGRLWGGERRESEQHKEATLSQYREYAYDESTNPKSGFKEFARWFIELSHVLKNEEGIYSPESIDFYNILDKAIQDSLNETLKSTGWTKIACDKNDRIVTFNGKNIPVEVNNLSAGTRVVLGTVADIVFRCCKLNRFLRENVLKETTGIVLIDEIELHLHPSWQQKILPTLCKIFPRIQFIVTTHSPQVVSSVPAECVRILDEGKVLSSNVATEGTRAEQVLNDVFK